MAISRAKVLESLGLSAPLLALVNGTLEHPGIPTVCRPLKKQEQQPLLHEEGEMIPLWADATGTPDFYEVIHATPTPDGPQFWSVIFETGDEPSASLMTRTEHGLFFWLFYWLLERQNDEPDAAGWNLPGLAEQLGFADLDKVKDFRQAIDDGEDYHDRLHEIVLAGGADPLPANRAELERLCDEGEELVDAERFNDALERFRSAWQLLPEPRNEQDDAVRIMAAAGDCHFHLGNWEECHQAMQHCLRSGAALDNPFIRLRLGQSMLELGNEEEAANWLVPVYLTEGRRPFADDDPKYLEFFRGKLKPPTGGWPEGW